MKRLILALALVVAGAGAGIAARQQAAPAGGPRPPNIIADVRAAIAKNDFALGERLLKEYRDTKGTTPETLEALSDTSPGQPLVELDIPAIRRKPARSRRGRRRR